MQADLRALFAELVQHLHDETDALIRGDAGRVAALAAQKNDILQRIAPLAQRAGSDLPRDLVAEARQLNDRNALLLAPRLVAARARLDALRQSGSPTLYGADGRTQAFGRTAARA
jgi:flagellar biosynthesis/type III secretory pathway chaperone